MFRDMYTQPLRLNQSNCRSVMGTCTCTCRTVDQLLRLNQSNYRHFGEQINSEDMGHVEEGGLQ